VVLARLSRSDSVRDQRIERLEPLVAPQTLLDELPLSDEQAEILVRDAPRSGRSSKATTIACS